jgi:ABC-type transporter Mla subunit MlaD
MLKLKLVLSLVLRTVGCILLILLCLVSYQTYKSVKLVNSTLSQTQQDLAQLSDDLHGTSQNLNAALIQIGLTSDQARLAAMEQRAYWAKNSAETHVLLTTLNTTVEHADGMLVAIGMDADRQVVANGQMLSEDLFQMKRGLTEATGTIADLDKVVKRADTSMTAAGPDMQATLNNLAKTSANVNDATKSISLASKDIQVKVHQLTSPVKWWMTVGKAVISMGADAGSYIAGFFK